MSRRRPLHPHNGEDTNVEDLNSSHTQKEGEEEAVPTPNEKNPLAWLSLPWHLSMVIFYVLLLYYGVKLMTDNHHILDPKGRIPKLGGRFKFLTHINQWVQLIFFTLQLLTDLTPCRYKKNLQKMCDFVFTTMVFPIAMLVGIVFWGIYMIDRELMYPSVFDLFVPSYMNHFWHTTVVLWALCEIFFVFHEFPSTAIAACSIFSFSAGYIAWIFYIFATTDFWVYPFMRLLPPVLMTLFFAGCIFFTLGLFLLGKIVSYYRWGKSSHKDHQMTGEKLD